MLQAWWLNVPCMTCTASKGGLRFYSAQTWYQSCSNTRAFSSIYRIKSVDVSLCLCLCMYVCEGERDRGKMMGGHKIYYKQSNSVFSKRTFSVSFSLFLSCVLFCSLSLPFTLPIHTYIRDCITLSLGKLKDPLKTRTNVIFICLGLSIKLLAIRLSLSALCMGQHQSHYQGFVWSLWIFTNSRVGFK